MSSNVAWATTAAANTRKRRTDKRIQFTPKQHIQQHHHVYYNPTNAKYGPIIHSAGNNSARDDQREPHLPKNQAKQTPYLVKERDRRTANASGQTIIEKNWSYDRNFRQKPRWETDEHVYRQHDLARILLLYETIRHAPSVYLGESRHIRNWQQCPSRLRWLNGE